MFQENVPLSTYSNIKIGGPARYFTLCTSVSEVAEALTVATNNKWSIKILGGATNLLIGDEGVDGAVLKVDIKELKILDASRVRVGAGNLIKEFTDFAARQSLSGMEWAGGLPGTVGGAIWGNAGAFKGEIKDTLIEVISLDVQTLQLITRTNKEAHFSYRNSIFKENSHSHVLENVRMKPEVILSAVFQFTPGEQAQIKSLTEEKVQYRKNKQPLEYPNIGSIFKNVDIKKVPASVLERFKEKIKQDPFPVLPTAVLTAAAGLKGRRVGGAVVSDKHSNFIINAGGATAKDVKDLMAVVRQKILEEFGVELEQEVIFW